MMINYKMEQRSVKDAGKETGVQHMRVARRHT